MKKCRCGCDLRVIESRRRYYHADDDGSLRCTHGEREKPLYSIECPGCKLFTGDFEDIADAWGSWNACQEILDGVESRLDPCVRCSGQGRVKHDREGFYCECERCKSRTAGDKMLLLAEEAWDSGEVYCDEEET